MHSCDVLIVGGGPGGSSCARALACSGLHVVLLDKAVFPRNKVCGGWITPWVLQALEIDADEYSRGRMMQKIRGFRISSMNTHEIEVTYDHTVSYGIRRVEFDEYLLRRSGVEVQEGVSASKIERSGDEWIVNANIKCRLLVGAGGHFCPVAKYLGEAHSGTPVIAQEIEFAMDPEQAGSCGIDAEIPELYFCRDFLGYAWCFRKGDFLNIGLGRLDQHALSQHVARFLDFLHDSGKLRFNIPGRLPGHAYLLYGYAKRDLLADSVLLIGDAAGLAFPQSGEGIRPAIESGLLAAQVIKAAAGTYSRQNLAEYPELVKKKIGRSLGLPAALSASLPFPLRNQVATYLLKQQWFCRQVVVQDWFLR
jgi:menaquinone-9 beta-reductase